MLLHIYNDTTCYSLYIISEYHIVQTLIGKTLLQNLPIFYPPPNVALNFVAQNSKLSFQHFVYQIVKVIPIRIFYYMIIPSHHNVDQLIRSL